MKKSIHNFMHKALLSAACILTHVAVWGQTAGSTFWVDHILYEVLNETEVELTDVDYKNLPADEVRIPSAVTVPELNKTYTVTAIGFGAFYGCSRLRSIHLPNSVTTIETRAFEECHGLTSFNFSDSVTTIGDYAFKRCSKLTSISIPKAVTTIGERAFEACSGLETMYFHPVNPPVVTDNFLGYGFKPDVIYVPGEAVETYRGTAPYSQYSIKAIPGVGGTFVVDNLKYQILNEQEVMVAGPKKNNYELKGEVRIPSTVTAPEWKSTYTVTAIGGLAFYDCYNLTGIDIPNTVTTIGERAFSGCSGLKNIHIPHSVTTIGERVFGNCKVLTSITVAEDNANYSSADGVFLDKAQQKLIRYPEAKTGDYQVPRTVTTIEDYAFYDCGGLTSINFPDSVTTIGGFAFSYCTGLTSLDLPNSVKTIGDYAFSGCKGLISAIIGNSVEKIGYLAFTSCSILKTIYLYSINPPTVTQDVLGYDFAPQMIHVPEEAVEAYLATEPYCYYGINAIGGIKSMFAVGNIGYKVLNETEVEVTGIENKNLPASELRIPSAVTAPLWNKTYTVTTIGYAAFEGCGNITSIQLPRSLTTIEAGAFFKCVNLKSLRIPHAVTKIGNMAMGYCSKLKTIYFHPGNPPEIINNKFGEGFSPQVIYVPREAVAVYRAIVPYNEYPIEAMDGVGSTFVADHLRYEVLNETDVMLTGCENDLPAGELPIPSTVTAPEWDKTYVVTTIGNRAFEGCSSLTSVHIPGAVTTMGSEAFHGCEGLETMYLHPVNPPAVTDNNFGEGFSPRMIYVPGEAIEAYRGTAPYSQYSIEAMGGAGSMFAADHLWYKVLNETDVMLTGCENDLPAGELPIPSAVTAPEWDKTYAVTTIGDRAFEGCSGLTSVHIPGSVTTMGSEAFHGCEGLETMYLHPVNPPAVTDNNFGEGCSPRMIYVPGEAVEAYRAAMPYSQYPIEAMPGAGSTFVADHLRYEVLNETDVMLTGCENDLPAGELPIPSTVTAPEWQKTYAVTTIGDRAFEGCSGLTSVYIPRSVTTMGSEAFHGCEGLETMYLHPVNPPAITDNNFGEGCSPRVIYVPKEAVSAYRAATPYSQYPIEAMPGAGSMFTVDNLKYQILNEQEVMVWSCENKYQLTGEFRIPSTVTYPEWKKTYTVTALGYRLFNNTTGLTSIHIPESVNTIGDGAFENCWNLVYIRIPDAVTTIGNRAFIGCSSLKNIRISDAVTTIGERAFEGCTGLTYISLGNNLTTIGSRAFRECKGLTSIDLPRSLTTMGSEAFHSCYGLTSIDIPDFITTIGDRVFESCIRLTDINFGNSVTTIGDYAFENCKGLTFISIPNSVTTIGSRAFGYCEGLTGISLGNSVTTIGEKTFEGCTKLEYMYCYPVFPPTVAGYFGYSPRFTTIYVPRESVMIYKNVWPYQAYCLVGIDPSVGIGGVEDTDAAPGGMIYDLKGRLIRRDGNLQALPKGIYILDGKRVVR